MFDDMYTWYREDLPLVERLGLKLPDSVPHGGDYVHAGTVSLEWGDEPGDVYAKVRVEVGMLPAQFFKFTIEEIMDGDGRTGVIETGSGTLRGYWPVVEMVAQGMITIRLETSATF